MTESSSPFLAVLKPHTSDIGAFTVQRSLPSLPFKTVGPFIFFDHMGPATLAPGQGMDVRPHPHIGLATVTYLFDGEIEHRDSLGSDQRITPGAVNWMTAGRGIVHSERTPPDVRERGGDVHGIQTWVALPQADEETEPSFSHHDASSLPDIFAPGVHMRLILGKAFGETSPVKVFSPIFYLAVDMEPCAAFVLPPEYEQRAVYTVQGEVTVNGELLSEQTMGVLAPGSDVNIVAGDKPARLMLLGGAPLDGDRFIFWNFVSSSRERIEQAKTAWMAQEMGHVPGETEWIPIPERKPAAK
ncbi:Putative quercetin 2,3-dioxygenase [Pandoraea pneumonica]|uniref:Quercetin 2,3-dioxygenase n=1 Tax=Pandoraea pneumonica TaxID=2508299 RepID=A0A5E4XKF3_9BURK|nr:pirin family protein [Pandoraea pneumonica]VVE36743.1 Putative quercetin 2,3-dioxygenase [Pandoraea pneumonica]